MTRPSSRRSALAWGAIALLLVAPAAPAAAKRAAPAPEEARDAVPQPADRIRVEAHALTPTDHLDRGRQAFENADFARSREILEPIDPMELGREQRIELHEMLGKALYILAGDRPDEEADPLYRAAEAQFFEVLKLDKNHRMDKIRTPGEIIGAFESVRRARERELRKFPVEPERTIPGWDVPKVSTQNMFLAFAPAGVFRLAFLGTPKRGGVLLTTQLLTLGASGFTFGYLDWAKRGGTSSFYCQSATVKEAADALLVVNYVASIVTVAVWVVGIVDAFASQRYHKPAAGGRKRKVAAGWRWGPPTALLPP